MSLPETTAPLAVSIAAENGACIVSAGPFIPAEIKLPEPITAAAAAEFGFSAISTGFSRSERPLLESLVTGLGKKPFRLVWAGDSVEVWRLSSETNTISPPSVVSLIKIHAGGSSL